MNIPAILHRARELAKADQCGCAHIAINDSACQLGCFDLNEQALRIYAAANGITPEPTWNDCSSIHRFWDEADQGARDASWVKAMGEG